MAYLFSERLKQILAELGLSQAKCAARAHVSSACLTYWTSGSRNPTAEKIYDLALLFKVSSDWLLGLSDARN